MSHLIDILSCIMEGVFQLKPPLSIIVQEINRVNGGLVLKPKLLCAEIENNTHMRISTTHLEIQGVSTIMALCSSQFSEHVQEKTFSLARSGTTPMFTKAKFLLMSLLHRHL